jgi:hypothetical protein
MLLNLNMSCLPHSIFFCTISCCMSRSSLVEFFFNIHTIHFFLTIDHCASTQFYHWEGTFPVIKMYLHTLCNFIRKCIDVILTMHNFRLPRRCKWDRRSFSMCTQCGMIVSYRRLWATYRSHRQRSSLTLEYESDMSSRKVGTKRTIRRYVKSQKSADFLILTAY